MIIVAGLLLLSLLMPILPWIALGVTIVAGQNSKVGVWALIGSGVLLDLWWGGSVGALSLLLVLLIILVKVMSRFWPTERRSLTILASVLSLVTVEIYLHQL